VAILLLVQGCGGPQKVALTSDDSRIPRKVVIREDSTPLFSSRDLRSVAGFARQWQVYFLVRQGKKFVQVSPTLEVHPENTYFLEKDASFEWNTYFCLSYANSPRTAGRPQIITFRTPEQARIGSGDSVLIEKPYHLIHWNNPQPIMKDLGGGVYHVTSLYDNVDSLGNYVFLGNYTSGYVRYQQNAHVLLRYVSREQLDENIKVMLGSRLRHKEAMSPTEMDDFWGPLRSLLADFGVDSEAGVNEMLAVFREEHAPSEAQKGIFQASNVVNSFNPNLAVELHRVSEKMISHFQDNTAWNEHGFSFVPAEWLK
jgi:hypothetical protein